jgi:predicted dehydrogenase
MYRLASDLTLCKRLPIGMIGGGVGSFFAPYHRAAMRLSNRWHLAAGVFSSDPEKSKSAGFALGVEEIRVYPDAVTLAREERARGDGVKAVAVVTPNHLHFDACQTLLQAGIGVICDKPLVNDLDEAKALSRLAQTQGVFFGMTYTYCGYPMVREARARVLADDIGPIRFAYAEYLQEWLADKPENLGAKAGGWRTDPAKAGPTGTMGDVGTHAFNLLEFVTGARVSKLSATLLTTVEGRQLDDNDVVKLRFDRGFSGLMWATQAAPGHRNGLRFKIVGTLGSLEWRQEAPETLFIGRLGQPDSILHRGQRTMTPAGAAEVTLPAGNPEGYLEALGILYSDFADAVGAEVGCDRPAAAPFPYPDLEEGLRGVALCAAALESNRNDGSWTQLTT